MLWMEKPKNNFSKIKSGKSESNSGGSLCTGGRKEKAVSYTHLDVYKRQDELKEELKERKVDVSVLTETKKENRKQLQT